jgi:hypothetical protein
LHYLAKAPSPKWGRRSLFFNGKNGRQYAMVTKTPSFVRVLSLAWLIAAFQAGLAQSSEYREEILISLDGAPSMGDMKATVTMAEFSDYQCPRSSEYFNRTMRKIVDEYVKTGKIKYLYLDFPWSRSIRYP